MNFLEKIEEVFTTLENGQIYQLVIQDTEKALIEKALERTSGNQILAARILGLNRNTIRSKIRKYSINTRKYKV